MKKIILMVLALTLVSGLAFAEKTTYIVTNHRFNYVKIKEVNGKIAAERQMTQPKQIDEQGLRAALASVNLARTYLIKKEVDTQRVFDDSSIDFLAPALVKAFSQATESEEIVFAYLTKNPIFILRNDRLNICKAWIHGDELHIKFEKLYAKVTGDVDKRGNEAREISRAMGLRVRLELGEGQKLGVNDTDEVVLDMNYNYVKPPEEKKIPQPATMSGEKPAQIEAEAAKPAKDVAPKKGDKDKNLKNKAAAPVEVAPTQANTAKDRLEELNQLKKDGLIDKKEYDEKKKEILKEL